MKASLEFLALVKYRFFFFFKYAQLVAVECWKHLDSVLEMKVYSSERGKREEMLSAVAMNQSPEGSQQASRF